MSFVFFLAENLKDNHENTKDRKHEIEKYGILHLPVYTFSIETKK